MQARASFEKCDRKRTMADNSNGATQTMSRNVITQAIHTVYHNLNDAKTAVRVLSSYQNTHDELYTMPTASCLPMRYTLLGAPPQAVGCGAGEAEVLFVRGVRGHVWMRLYA